MLWTWFSCSGARREEVEMATNGISRRIFLKQIAASSGALAVTAGGVASPAAAAGAPPAPQVSQMEQRNLKRNWMRFAAALLAVLASFIADPNAALAAAPQHRDQVPGFFRLQVGDLEVTALSDGVTVIDPHWLTGKKATMDGIEKAFHEDPHLLDGAENGFLVNTGKQLILVDAGAGTWFGAAFGHLASSLRSAGYTT